MIGGRKRKRPLYITYGNGKRTESNETRIRVRAGIYESVYVSTALLHINLASG